jgi:putative nucleotidyltransferase with HDIG domain
MDNNYPPYAFLDSEGHMQGIAVDQWQFFEKRTGIKVEIFGMEWAEALSRMETGEFDVIDTIFYNDTRAKQYDFTSPYATIDVSIYFNNHISGITDVESLKNFPVAVKSGDANIDYLRSRGIQHFLEYESYEAIIHAAKNKNVIVFVVDKPPAEYLLYLNDMQGDFNATQPLYSGQFYRAVAKGNTEILTLMENGFAQISGAEYDAIRRKWFGTPPLNNEYLRFMIAIAGSGIGIVLLLVLWNHSLQSRVRKKTAELSKAYTATLEGWSRAMDLRDQKTEGHTLRVAELSERLALSMGLNGEERQQMRHGALLHDIGKIGIPDAILHKPDVLTEEEWKIMRKHPVYAYEFLSPIPYLQSVLDIPYCHHEKWDGSGYPRGLKGEDIPLAARIFTVVDVWDALITTDRPYRSAWPKEKAYQYILEQSGKYFDPQIVVAFCNLLYQDHEISQEILTASDAPTLSPQEDLFLTKNTTSVP